MHIMSSPDPIADLQFCALTAHLQPTQNHGVQARSDTALRHLLPSAASSQPHLGTQNRVPQGLKQVPRTQPVVSLHPPTRHPPTAQPNPNQPVCEECVKPTQLNPNQPTAPTEPQAADVHVAAQLHDAHAQQAPPRAVAAPRALQQRPHQLVHHRPLVCLVRQLAPRVEGCGVGVRDGAGQGGAHVREMWVRRPGGTLPAKHSTPQYSAVAWGSTKYRAVQHIRKRIGSDASSVRTSVSSHKDLQHGEFI